MSAKSFYSGRLQSHLLRRAVSLLVLAALVALAATGGFAAQQKLPPKYRQWLEQEVPYIITNEERNSFLHLTTDDDRDKFIERFWEIRNPNPGSPTNTYKEEHYQRLAYANQFFGHETGTPGWRTDMGKVYIELGAPQQRAKYLGQANVRPMEIWFYGGTHPALPPFFYVVFYQREAGGDFRLYSPYMDTPAKLISSASTEGDKVSALKVIDKTLGREVARTTLSLLPDEPVDLDSATSSLQSDVMLNTIRNLANTPMNKDLLNERHRILESVSHRVILSGEYLDVFAVPMRDHAGGWNLHYLLRYRRPEDFTLTRRADGRYYYGAEVVAKVSDPKGKLIFEQRRKLSEFVDPAKVEVIKSKVFGYEGLVPIAPGKYKLEFTLSNEAGKTAIRDLRDVTVPAAPTTGLAISDVVPFVDASETRPELAPFSFSGVKFTPAIGQGISVVPGQDLKFFYQIWAPPAEVQAHRGSVLNVEYAYGRMGLRDTKSLQEEVKQEQFDASGSMVSGKKIPTADLGAGNYRLTVTVTDPETHQKTFSSFQFRVSDTGGPANAWDVADPQLSADILGGVYEYQRGLCYEAQGDSAMAARLFRAAVQRDAHNEAFRAKLIETSYAAKDFAQVVDVYSRGGLSAKTDDQTVLRIAESLDKTGDMTKSIQVLESAIALKPNSGPLYLALAGYYQRAGNAGRAAEMERKGRGLIATAQPAS